MTDPSFSTQVKQEICSILRQEDASGGLASLKQEQEQAIFDPDFALYFMLLSQGEFRFPRIRLALSLPELAEFAIERTEALFGVTPACRKRGDRRFVLELDGKESYRQVTGQLKRLFGFNPALGQFTIHRDQLELRAQRSALQGLFLSSGSIANPELSYQVEFQFRRRAAAEACDLLFRTFNLSPLRLQRSAYHLLYFKKQQDISEVLRLLGAGLAVLDFESVQATKEMMGDVNRVVNCDQANLKRMLDASYRQIKAIRLLEAHGLLEDAPPELQEAAELRLRYPEYSLREMAEAADPPVGRSGMNHRLQKLLRMAEGLDGERPS